ncbi:LPS assembly lipoprotein LptE [Dokdonella sp.]|uniref:LPS-assembly lipoprotein LptE n=1 Tax=Dokdonella sp. TaxID=2291710 RepID=UPI0025BFB82E|nr:LPS assembly lipoprotein LptE [Dokdonella sp.]MBX3692888.1 hypothetical protein [Dokdonella sp.]MCW5566829.1 hypothetical protein [Dokdonella sp.]
MIPRRVSFVLVALATLALNACGFHLRQEARLPSGMQRVQILGAEPVSTLGRDLAKALARAGAVVVDAAGEGTAQLRIGVDRTSTDVLSVGSNARANEYTLRYHVEFDVLAADGDPLVPRQVIELTREFTFDATQALGVAAEQDLLTRELQREMVQAIMRRIEAGAEAG